MIVVRYADDTIVGFQRHADADRFLRELRARLAAFGLDLHPDKTRLIEFGRFAVERRAAKGLGKPETFDFLGFTHICAKSRDGRFLLMRQTMGLSGISCVAGHEGRRGRSYPSGEGRGR